jgi:hypothetical protein
VNPQAVRFTESLHPACLGFLERPRNAAGKFLKRELRDLVEKGSLTAVSR